MLGHQPGRHAFEQAAHGNGIRHLTHRELAHHKAPRLVGLHQPLLFQGDQRGTHRRTRRAQQLGNLLLGQALPGLELTPQDALAQLQ